MAQACVYPVIYLKMGETAFVDHPSTITTVLGSCVAVTLFDRKRGFGAMCHGVLPSCESAHRCAAKCSRYGHYVECSVLAMAHRFRSFGVRHADIEARVFGGADLFALPVRSRSLLAVGPQNVEAAARALSASGIALSAKIVGGSSGCRVSFETISGVVSVQRLDPAIMTACEC